MSPRVLTTKEIDALQHALNDQELVAVGGQSRLLFAQRNGVRWAVAEFWEGATAEDIALLTSAPDLLATVQHLRAELAQRDELINGRATPPTPEERALVEADGDAWVVSYETTLGGPEMALISTSYEWEAWDREAPANARYMPRDRRGRPRVWPVVIPMVKP